MIEIYASTSKQTAEQAEQVAQRTRVANTAEPYTEPPALPPARLQLDSEALLPQRAALKQLQQLAPRLPAGYVRLMQTVGPGILRDTVRVYGPAAILREHAAWQRRIAEYWFWGDGPLLSQPAAEHALRIADTLAGDEIVFLPAAPDTVLMLPREDEQVVLLSKTGLLAAIGRLVSTASGRWPQKLRYQPFADG